MAGAGRRTFAPGEVLTASNVMDYLQDQAVMNFAGTAARGSAIGTAVSQGMTSFLQSTGAIETYFDAFGTANPGGRTSAGWYSTTKSDGLVPINPATVTIAPTTSTGSFNALGTVSFSNSSIVSLDGVFSSKYKNYRIIVNATASTQDDLQIRLRASGTASTSSYYWQYIIASGASIIASDANNVDRGRVVVNLASNSGGVIIDVLNPYETKRTTWLGYGATGGSHLINFVGGVHTVASPFDGISFYTAGYNITGEITVFGYNTV